MTLSRRDMIRSLGAAIIAGVTPKFVPSLLPESAGAYLKDTAGQYIGVDPAGDPDRWFLHHDGKIWMAGQNRIGKSQSSMVFLAAAVEELTEKYKRKNEWDEIFG